MLCWLWPQVWRGCWFLSRADGGCGIAFFWLRNPCVLVAESPFFGCGIVFFVVAESFLFGCGSAFSWLRKRVWFWLRNRRNLVAEASKYGFGIGIYSSCKGSSKGFLLWNPVAPELWNLGALKPWKPATLDSWSLVIFEPCNPATLESCSSGALEHPGTFDSLQIWNLHWEPSSFTWNFEFSDSHNMDPLALVHGILEPGNFECWKYEV